MHDPRGRAPADDFREERPLQIDASPHPIRNCASACSMLAEQREIRFKIQYRNVSVCARVPFPLSLSLSRSRARADLYIRIVYVCRARRYIRVHPRAATSR